MLPKMWCLWPGRFHISLTGEFLTLKPKISSFACSRWWFQIFFYVHPYLEKVSNLTNLFQLGWNHQLDVASDEIYPIFGRVNPRCFLRRDISMRNLCRGRLQLDRRLGGLGIGKSPGMHNPKHFRKVILNSGHHTKWLHDSFQIHEDVFFHFRVEFRRMFHL